LIGTIRRECLDRTLVWTAADLEMKRLEFQRSLQQPSGPCGAGGATTGRKPGGGCRTGEYPFVSLAVALSWAVSKRRSRRRVCPPRALPEPRGHSEGCNGTVLISLTSRMRRFACHSVVLVTADHGLS
jgi:hypothetical protein